MKNPSRKKRLSEKSVEDLKRCREPAFDLLLDYTMKEGFEVETSSNLVNRLHSKMDNLIWRADQKCLQSDGKKPGSVLSHNVTHHGIHHLIAKRFPGVKGRPMMTFWAESIASASNIYFAATYFNTWGATHPFSSYWLREFKGAADRLGLPFIQPFQSSLRDPFDAFKVSAGEIFQLTLCYWEVALSQGEKGRKGRRGNGVKAFQERLLSLSRTLRYFSFISIFDYSVGVYYALRYCGERSSAGAGDLRDLRIANSMLADSLSMEDFLTRLGVRS